MSQNGEKLLRVSGPKGAAEQLGKSPKTVWRWIRDGKLTACRESPRQTRVPASAVKEFWEHQE